MSKLTKVAAAVSSALLLMGYGVSANADITGSTPSAYAESLLHVSNFQITLGDGTSLIPLLGTQIQGLQANVQSNLSANLNGTPAANAASINPLAVPAQSININASVGAGYIPFTSYLVNTLAAGTFAGAASTHSGNALQLNGAPPTDANTQAQVNINASSSIGNADSRQNLATTFLLNIEAPLEFLVTFDAVAFMRVALGQPEVIAQVDRNWGLDVTVVGDPLADPILSWSPDGSLATGLTGTCVGAGLCSEVDDPFTLNLKAALQTTGDSQRIDALNNFGLLVTLLPGEYQLAINHDTSADAQAVPEPGSLALLGAALLGLVGLRRKSKRA